MRILYQNKGLKTEVMRNLGQLLAQDCLLCASSDAKNILCSACADDLPLLPQPACLRCALPLPNGEICGHCLSKPPHHDAAFAAFSYEFPLDKLVQAFKYGHRLALGNYFGQQLALLTNAPAADLIIPLPLHQERLRQRGFNQALELARPVSKAWKLPIDAISCRRTRNTPAQADLPWSERVKNIRGAFQCSTDLSGKRIILVDDVMTTGASLNECARILKLHGAAEITLLVVARALPKAS